MHSFSVRMLDRFCKTLKKFVQMFFLFLSLSLCSLAETDLFICFYGSDPSFCSGDFQFSVDDFAKYQNTSFPEAEKVFFEFIDSLKKGDVIDLAKFDKSNEIDFHNNGTIDFASVEIKTSSDFIPNELHFSGIDLVLSVSSALKNATFENTNIQVQDGKLIAQNILVDGVSLSSINSLQADFIEASNILNGAEQFSTKILSQSENSQFVLRSFQTLTLNVYIFKSQLLFGYSNNESVISFDLEEFYGNVTIDHSSLRNKDILITLECLCYSSYFHFPFLILDFVGFLTLQDSNWPYLKQPILQINAKSNPLINNIAVSGFIPAYLTTAPFMTTNISPTKESSGFIKVSLGEASTFTIIQPFLLTEQFYFYIRELSSPESSSNTTITANPPLLYVNIDRFEGEHDYILNGSAFFVLNHIPGKNSTIYVDHLWIESNELTFPFDLEGASKIRVTDYVKMKTYPTHFLPQYIGEPPQGEVSQRKFNLICAKLLKEEKEDLLLPENGIRGFVQGASIVEPYYEQDPQTEAVLKCFGMKIEGNINSVSNILCFSDDTSKCPSSSQPVTEDNWNNYVRSDVLSINLYVYKSGITLSFMNFSKTILNITGSSYEKIAIVDASNINKITAEKVELLVSSQNPNATVELRDSKFGADIYSMGPLVTDISSLKTIPSVFFQNVTITDVDENHITFGEDITLEKNGITVSSQDATIQLLSDEVKFSFNANRNNTLNVEFHSSNAQVSFDSLSKATDLFTISNFSGTLTISESVVPFTIRNARDVTIQANSDLTFSSKLEISGQFSSNVNIASSSLSVLDNANITTHIITDDFYLADHAIALIDSISVNKNFDVYPGSILSVPKVRDINCMLRIHYNLTDLPRLEMQFLNSDNAWNNHSIDFIYEGISANDAIRGADLFFSNIPIIQSDGIVCSSFQYTFHSNFVYYNNQYSILKSVCSGDSISIALNDNAVPPPQPTPIPYIPTQSPVPDNTSEQVVIISCTVLAFFFIIIVILVKWMNKKKKYTVKKKTENIDLNSTPLMNPHEGNAE